MTGDVNLRDYYRRRAPEYEDIYTTDDAARNEEQRTFAAALKKHLHGRDVVEVACGTGHWTQLLSETAQSIVATDAVEEVLAAAKGKAYSCPVSFRTEDAYRLSFADGSFNGGMACMWFSHVPRSTIDSFLTEFHRVLRKGSEVFIGDNTFTPGIGGELIVKEGDENTYKLRKLRNGNEFLVLKNYFSVDELVRMFSRHVNGFDERNVFCNKYFWYVAYTL